MNFIKITALFFLLLVTGCISDDELEAREVSEQYLMNVLNGNDEKASTFLIGIDDAVYYDRLGHRSDIIKIYKALKTRFGSGLEITLKNTSREGSDVIYQYVIHKARDELMFIPIMVTKTGDKWEVNIRDTIKHFSNFGELIPNR